MKILKLSRVATNLYRSYMQSQLAPSTGAGEASNNSPRLLIHIGTLWRQNQGTGIQRVVTEIARAMFNSHQSDALPILIVRQDNSGLVGLASFGKNFALDRAEREFAVSLRPGDTLLLTDYAIFPDSPSIQDLKSLKKQSIRVISLVYDMLPVKHPRFFGLWGQVFYRLWLMMVGHVDEVIAISSCVATDFEKYFERKAGIGPYRFHSIQLGSDFGGLTAKSIAPRPNKLSTRRQKNFVMVGTVEVRKDHITVIRAFERLWSEGHDFHLTVVGKPGWKAAAALEKLRFHAELNGRLKYVMRCTDKDLQDYYQASDALIAYSFDEGLGLPILEAASLGKPVLVRDTAVFREAAQFASATFLSDRCTPLQLAREIESWAQDPFTHEPKSVPLWSETAESILKLVETAPNWERANKSS